MVFHDSKSDGPSFFLRLQSLNPKGNLIMPRKCEVVHTPEQVHGNQVWLEEVARCHRRTPLPQVIHVQYQHPSPSASHVYYQHPHQVACHPHVHQVACHPHVQQVACHPHVHQVACHPHVQQCYPPHPHLPGPYGYSRHWSDIPRVRYPFSYYY